MILGVTAKRIPGLTGVWVGEQKISSSRSSGFALGYESWIRHKYYNRSREFFIDPALWDF